MITALSGSNSYLISDALRKVTNTFVAEYGELALERLNAAEVEYNQILGSVESLPFLATKKMVILDDLSLNKDAAAQLDTLIERAGDTTDLVIVETKPDKRSSYYKQLKKLENFTEFNELDEYQLATWLVDTAKSADAQLSKTDAQYMIQRVGINQLKLSHELDKLVQYDSVITRATINALTEENPTSTVFNLVDAAFSGNLKRALQLYDEQRQQRVEPQAIHGMLVWQMHAVAVAVMAPAGTSSNQIAKDSGLSPYVVQKSQRIAQQMGRQNVREFTKLLRDIDYKGKHQTFDYDEALRYVLIKLAQ